MGTATTPSAALPAGDASAGRALCPQRLDGIGAEPLACSQSETAARTYAPSHSGITASLPCTRSSVRRARAFVLKALQAWAVSDDLAHRGETVVSELMTNVVEHTGTALCQVTVELAEQQTIRIAVSDNSCDAPCVRTPDDEEESGRGLRLIAALCRHWGYDIHSEGKVTWAVLSPA
ncbi:ATP-binding protein [Streptomyces sp. NBRC 110465]|uniref:ATP-binding protein n=1 Tax=Streptomyces sp. NBRC 110465 TaxID=1897621 RepID=UPI0009A1072D|nr:ATP-binding protein [Streptomyces sp. NBRC 110465]